MLKLIFTFTDPSTAPKVRFNIYFLSDFTQKQYPQVNAYDKEIRLSGGLASMGKTVESFRMALEGEINCWSGFARALRKPDNEAFDPLMDMRRTYASESSCATSPIIFEPMVMSIPLFQQKRIRQLEQELQALKPEAANLSKSYEARVPLDSKPENIVQAVANGGEQRRLF
jgi:hypothetical protein